VRRGGTFALSQVVTSISHTSTIPNPPFPAGDFPDVDEKGQEKWPRGDENSWKAALCDVHTGNPPLSAFLVYCATELTADLPEITKSVVHHVQTSLGRAPYNIDDFGAYQAAALSVRDNLIVSPWPCYRRPRIVARISLDCLRYPVFTRPNTFCSVLMQIMLLLVPAVVALCIICVS
jgi:hypothetical protein